MLGEGTGQLNTGEVRTSADLKADERCSLHPATAAVLTYVPQFLQVLSTGLFSPFFRHHFLPPPVLNTLGLGKPHLKVTAEIATRSKGNRLWLEGGV